MPNKGIVSIAASLAALICLIGCSGNPKSEQSESAASDSFLYKQFHQAYLDAANIESNCASERKNAITKAEEVCSGDCVYLTEDSTLLSGLYYAVTSNQTALTYYGRSKDNRPDGFGVIKNLDSYYYIGNFTKGKFDGYGALFSQPEDFQNAATYASGFVQEGIIDSSLTDTVTAYLKNYVKKDGEWKDGKLNGNGNGFSIDLENILNSPVVENYWAGSIYPSVVITEYKKGKITGDATVYKENYLLYKGEAKNGQYDGKGTKYFPSGQEQYTGEWKDGQYDGKGKLYDENGDIIYDGEWKDGDYKS